MDPARQKRLQTIRVIIVDIIMLVSIVPIVVILVAAVTGWRINSDLSIEQNGLVSINSLPEGVSVVIDGEEQFQKTYVSKMVSGGRHDIALKKDGYMGWSKTVSVTPGWLLRVEYPRLFKYNREQEQLMSLNDIQFFKNSTNRRTVLYSTNHEWFSLTNLAGDVKKTPIDVRKVFPNFVDEATGVFNGNIEELKWSESGDHVIVKAGLDDKHEWAVINLNDSSNINITTNFDSNNIRMADFAGSSNDKVFVISNNNLHKVDVSTKTMSSIIAKNVYQFVSRGPEIVFTQKGKTYTEIRVMREDDKESTLVRAVEVPDARITLGISYFNSYDYLAFTINNHFYVYRGDLPTAGNDFNMTTVNDNEIGINPTQMLGSRNGEFFVLRENDRVLVEDLENEHWSEYDYKNSRVRFLDDHELYRVNDGVLIEWDFDGSNERNIVSGSVEASCDAFINNDNKYLYYVTKTDSGYTLIREKL